MKGKKWKDDKCRQEVGGKRENKKNCWKEVLEEERKSWYNNVWNRRREEFECRDFHKISHQWHDDNLEQLYEILFRIREFFRKRERGAGARKRIKEKKIKKE